MEAFHHMVPLSVFLVAIQNKTNQKKAHNKKEEIITYNENTHINLNITRETSRIARYMRKLNTFCKSVYDRSINSVSPPVPLIIYNRRLEIYLLLLLKDATKSKQKDKKTTKQRRSTRT